MANLPIEGMVANPKAIQALNFALSKIGSRYVWGDEGPSTFDCSGLAYWSYGQVGVRVPRVANDMYHGTPAIQATKNSLGDRLPPRRPGLLRQRHERLAYDLPHGHLHRRRQDGPCPDDRREGQDRRTVKWSRFFGATRIFSAVAAPNSTATATATADGHRHRHAHRYGHRHGHRVGQRPARRPRPRLRLPPRSRPARRLPRQPRVGQHVGLTHAGRLGQPAPPPKDPDPVRRPKAPSTPLRPRRHPRSRRWRRRPRGRARPPDTVATADD